MYHSFFRNHKSKYFISFILVFTIIFQLAACGISKDKNASFQNFTGQLFCQEVASSTISLHYTLQDPSAYGLDNIPATYGGFSSDPAAAMASIENCIAALHDFKDANLSPENQLTYDILDSYLETASGGADYLLYQEPLSPVTGLHAQLPVLLSEYQFYNAEDVDTYLQLLSQTGTYFNSLIAFEQAKSQNGLFMPDYQVDSVTAQCQSFVEMGDDNYLYTTFKERLNSLNNLQDNDKDSYISENTAQIQNVIFPAYTHLAEELVKLKGTGQNEKGLCFLPEGKDFYEYVVRQNTGISDSVPELQQMTKEQIIEDLQAMEKVLYPSGRSENSTSSETSEQTVETSGTILGNTNQTSVRTAASLFDDDASVLESAAPTSILNDLKTKISDAFPEIPPVNTSVKYVPAAMEEYLSPAFYMIPAIDNTSENVIYINQGQTSTGLNLYTTLAHEGYPGHLYQTVYFASQNADPVRSILDFGGYVEGWATYAEMMSYYMAPLSKNEATLLQKNSSVLLGLYALADMGIHYDGWTVTDTAAFFKDYGITDVNAIKNVYELIVGDPGNYLKYYLGYLKFFNLKKEIARELGEEFSQKEFHRAVLDVGPAPFDIVEETVRENLLK